MKIFLSVALLAFAGLFQEGDSAITGWTTPTITGAADGTGTLTVAEDQAINTAIETYVATTDAGSITSYSFETAVSPFAVDSSSGALTITATLDFETTQTYTLKIEAVDDAGTPATGTATITVTVTDVNENGVNEADPVFATTYSPCIVDGSTQDTTLTTVAATDADTDETITYSIGTGNTGTAFKIDTSSGLIQVNTGVTLDKSTTASYALEVEAEDDGSPVRTATTTVSVTVAVSCPPPENGAVAVAVSMMALFLALFITKL